MPDTAFDALFAIAIAGWRWPVNAWSALPAERVLKRQPDPGAVGIDRSPLFGPCRLGHDVQARHRVTVVHERVDPRAVERRPTTAVELEHERDVRVHPHSGPSPMLLSSFHVMWKDSPRRTFAPITVCRCARIRSSKSTFTSPS
jgi:hypothetical protein